MGYSMEEGIPENLGGVSSGMVDMQVLDNTSHLTCGHDGSQDWSFGGTLLLSSGQYKDFEKTAGLSWSSDHNLAPPTCAMLG